MGVDVFFVISGFVITGLLTREYERLGRLDWIQFYWRRFKRLAPALAVTVTVTALISVFLLSPQNTQEPTAWTGIGGTLFAANAAIVKTTGDYFAAPAESNPLLNLWSLSIEEQFYLVFPLVLFVGWKMGGRRPRRHAAVATVSLLALSSFVIMLTGLNRFPPTVWWLASFYGPVARAWEFAMGALLFIILGGRLIRGATGTVAGVLGAALLAGSLFTIDGHNGFPGLVTLLPTVGTALLLMSDDSPVTRILSTSAMVRIGDWSYSLYLWHWPLIVFAKTLWPLSPWAGPAAAVASVAPALIGFYVIEEPLRRAQVTRGRVAFIAGTLVPPLAASLCLLMGARSGWATQWEEANPAIPSPKATPCADDPSPQSTFIDGCLEGGGSSGVLIVIGDSQAGALVPGLAEGAARLNNRTIWSTRAGCPAALGVTTGTWAFDCAAWQAGLLDNVRELRPTAVVIANRSVAYSTPALHWRTIAGVPVDAPADQARAAYLAAVDKLVSALSNDGTRVIIVNNAPEVPHSFNEQSLFWKKFPRSVPPTFDASAFMELRAPVVADEEALAAKYSSVTTIDPAHVLCRANSCDQIVDGKHAYLDRVHLTPIATDRLAPLLEEALR